MGTLRGMNDMTDKEVIRNALEHYIFVNAATEYDVEKKVNAAKQCLEELKVSSTVSRDWLCNKYLTIARAIDVYNKYLDRFIKESPSYNDVRDEMEERRRLVLIKQVLKEFADGVGLFGDLPI